MEKPCCHDIPFLCECCQAQFQTPKRVQNPQLEVLRVKERKVLRMKSESHPCKCDDDKKIEQKTAQKTLKKQKRSKTIEKSSPSPNRNYEKEFENQESITQEPSTSNAYALKKHMERKRMEHYLPEQTTSSNTNLRTSPKLAGSLNRPDSKITTESVADATITARKTQMSESNKKRTQTKVPEISSSEHSQQQRLSRCEGSELESRYTYEKPATEAKGKNVRASLIPVLKRWHTKTVSEATTSNSSQEVEIVKPSTFIESVSEYKLLKAPEISTASNTSLSSVERKHSKVEGQGHKVSTIKSNQSNKKTKPPPPIKPKPASNKSINLKETQSLLQGESNKDIYEENQKSLQKFDLEQKSLNTPPIKHSTLEQAAESMSKTSIRGLTVRSQESGTHSQGSEHSICMRSSSHSLESKCEVVESINVSKFSHDHINIQKVDSKQYLKAQDTSKVTKVTRKHSEETDSIKDQQRYECTDSSVSIPQLDEHKTSVKCSFIPIIKSDSVEPNLQDCFQIVQEHQPDVASSEHLTEDMLELNNDQGGGTDIDFEEEMKEYEHFRNYRSSIQNKKLSNALAISNADEKINANENSNGNDLSLKIGIERNSLSSDTDDEQKKQLCNESSQLLSDGELDSENCQLTDSLKMIFEQAKRSYMEGKLLEKTELYEQKMQSLHLYEYTPIVNGEDDLDLSERKTHGIRKSHKTRHALPPSFNPIEHPITSRSPALSCILESIDSEQFEVENSRSQTHRNQQENIDYKSTSMRRGRDASGAIDLNEYREGSDFDTRLLRPFKYPTCVCEIPIQCQPMIKLVTPRPRALRSKQTQTLLQAELPHWEPSKTSTRKRPKQYKSMDSESEEREAFLNQSTLQGPLNDRNKNNTMVSQKSSQDDIKYESSYDPTLNQMAAGISSRNRKEHRTKESINLEERSSKKMKRNTSIPDNCNQPNKLLRDKDINTENKILKNKEQTDESEKRKKEEEKRSKKKERKNKV